MTIQTPDWIRDAVFYQIFPDRFSKSNRVKRTGLGFEPWDSPPNPYGFKGGDLYGVKDHLDYLLDLGINAIYFNPLTSSASNHRYHPYDYFKIDPLLGGDQAFRELLDAAHEVGIRIVPDGVFNHTSRGFWQFHHVLENGDGSPYVDWFYFNPNRLNRQKNWGAYPDEQEKQLLNSGVGSYDAIGYNAWWNLPALPKLNTNTQAVRNFIFEAAEYWLNFGADGWRLDVPSEINDDSFWREFRQRVKAVNSDAYIVGEIWHESQRWLQGDQFDAVMNYLVTAALMGWLIGENLPSYAFQIGDFHKVLRATNAAQFGDRIDYLLNLYAPEINYAQLNLLDSHDTPRFLTLAGGDKSALMLAYFFLFTYIGAPCIYYGDEIGLDGGPDPECRKSFPWDNTKWDQDLHAFMQSLVSLRKTHKALRRGTYERVYSDQDVIAYLRIYQGENLLVVINSGSNERLLTFEMLCPGKPPVKASVMFGNGQLGAVDGFAKELKIRARNGMVLKIE